MRIAVHHVTRYQYTEIASYSIQSVRLTPQACAAQAILSWRIETLGIEHAAHFRDSCGNLVHLITHTAAHAELSITAVGVVETSATNGVVQGLCEPTPIAVFLRHTPSTFPDEAIRELARCTSGGDAIARLHNLMHRVRDRVDYMRGATGGRTAAAEALAAGRGVCQDHAQIFIAAARSLGVPARYVTGYLLDDSDTPLQAHHAWAEAWVDNLGWIGFDVANRVCPTETYVRLAAGLDAEQAAPIRGSRRGGGVEKLDVDVSVQQQAVQQ